MRPSPSLPVRKALRSRLQAAEHQTWCAYDPELPGLLLQESPRDVSTRLLPETSCHQLDAQYVLSTRGSLAAGAAALLPYLQTHAVAPGAARQAVPAQRGVRLVQTAPTELLQGSSPPAVPMNTRRSDLLQELLRALHHAKTWVEAECDTAAMSGCC